MQHSDIRNEVVEWLSVLSGVWRKYQIVYYFYGSSTWTSEPPKYNIFSRLCTLSKSNFFTFPYGVYFVSMIIIVMILVAGPALELEKGLSEGS